MFLSRFLATLLAFVLLAICPQKTSADVGRYLAVFTTGDRAEGERVLGWHVPDGAPMLDSTSLRSDVRNLRWLRDRSLSLQPQDETVGGSVQFIGGDQLPGRVVAFVEESSAGTPTHLLVQTNQNIRHPADEPGKLVRVNLEFVSSIDWGMESNQRVEPGTILLTDGRRFSYSALSWSDDSVRVLHSNGMERIAFANISRLRLPARDFWASYFQELAVLCPNVSARLVRLETTSNLIATASESRFDAVATDSPEEHRRAAAMKATIARCQQRRRDLEARKKNEQKKLDQKLREYQRKRDQQLRKLQSDLRNMRNRMKNLPADEVERQVKEFDQRTRKRVEEQAERLSKQYKSTATRSIQRLEDQARDIDQQIKQVEQEGIAGSTAGGSSERWHHMVQPAWSLDPLWVRFNSIRTRWSFAPHEVPFSRLKPSSSVQRSTIGSSWKWQANCNVAGGPLRNGGNEYGWGFGVHATNELHFAIPSFATGFRSFIGLDEIVGPGGCIRAEVHLNAVNRTSRLFQSEFLIGSETVLDTGILNLTATGVRPASLILVMDAASQDRPAGADPLDIRDHADWLEPILLLNPSALQNEMQKYVNRRR